jgi:hypothetical protein
MVEATAAVTAKVEGFTMVSNYFFARERRAKMCEVKKNLDPTRAI